MQHSACPTFMREIHYVANKFPLFRSAVFSPCFHVTCINHFSRARAASKYAKFHATDPPSKSRLELQPYIYIFIYLYIYIFIYLYIYIFILFSLKARVWMTGIGCSKFHADKEFNILEVNMFLARIDFLVHAGNMSYTKAATKQSLASQRFLLGMRSLPSYSDIEGKQTIRFTCGTLYLYTQIYNSKVVDPGIFKTSAKCPR